MGAHNIVWTTKDEKKAISYIASNKQRPSGVTPSRAQRIQRLVVWIETAEHRIWGRVINKTACKNHALALLTELRTGKKSPATQYT